MNILRYLMNNQPFGSVLIVIVMVAMILFGLFALSTAMIAEQSLAQSSAMFLTGSLVLLVLVRSGAGRAAGIVARPRNRHWWIIWLVMAIPVPVAFSIERVEVDALMFEWDNAIEWLLQNLATGFFEEIWFRGA